MTTWIERQFQQSMNTLRSTVRAGAWVSVREGTDLDERLDLAPLRHLLRAHALRHLEWVTLDAGDDGMGVWPLLGALVELLDDDDLVARLTALEDDRNLHPNQPKLTSRPTSQNS